MITGNGMLAKELSKIGIHDDCILFASGVSNSLEDRTSEFEREKKLLLETIKEHPAKKIVYFSTCSIYDEEVRSRSYVIHKLAMENLIINHSIKYLILRVSNVVGSGGNKNTIINYFFNNIKQKAHFILWEFAERNILDISDLVFVTDELLKNNIENKIIDIANPINFKVLEIVHSIEIFSGFKAHYESLKKGHPLSINVSYITQLIPEYASRFDTSLNYMNKLLVKYFSNE